MFSLFVITCACKIRYGIMIDAGSSGTRAHIYKWNTDSEIPDVAPAPDPAHAWFIKLKMPLAKAAKNMSLINDIFDHIVKFGITHIPSEYIPKTRIFVYATAGMRMLNDLEQDIVIGNTYNYLLKKSPFKVKKEYVRVISGTEEGVFGWVSVNHLLGNFGNGKKTVGALDMGGASLQIALETATDGKPTNVVSIGKKSVEMFSHSYLGFGGNEALKSVTRSLSAVSDGSKSFEHPCYNVGYTSEYHGVRFVGTGDFEKCSNLVNEILLKASSFLSVNVPSLSSTNDFVAMASFYYTNSFLKLPPNSSLVDLKKKAVELCRTNWSIVAENNNENEYSSTYCWYSIYQWNALTNGFKFCDEKTKVLKLDEINGADLSWTIGAMLSHVAEIEIDETKHFTFPVLLIYNLIMFLIILPLFVVIEKKNKFGKYFNIL